MHVYMFWLVLNVDGLVKIIKTIIPGIGGLHFLLLVKCYPLHAEF